MKKQILTAADQTAVLVVQERTVKIIGIVGVAAAKMMSVQKTYVTTMNWMVMKQMLIVVAAAQNKT